MVSMRKCTVVEEEQWEPTTRPVIVCAANLTPDGRLLLGVRHWDNNMRSQFRAIYGYQAYSTGHWNRLVRFLQGRPQPALGTEIEQGFIDQFSRFYTREEAMLVAKQNGQVIVPEHQMLSLTALHTEDLW